MSAPVSKRTRGAVPPATAEYDDNALLLAVEMASDKDLVEMMAQIIDASGPIHKTRVATKGMVKRSSKRSRAQANLGVVSMAGGVLENVVMLMKHSGRKHPTESDISLLQHFLK